MKTVIIGGGIAGLAMAIYLHNHGMEVVVCERGREQSNKGNAFLMHAEGISLYCQNCPGMVHRLVFPENSSIISAYVMRTMMKSLTKNSIPGNA